MSAGTGCPALSPAALLTQGRINVLANENLGKPVDFDLCYIQCFTSWAWGQQVGTASLVLRWNRVRLRWDSLESVPPKCLSAVLRKVVKSKVYPALWHSHWMRQPSTQPVCSCQPQPQSSEVWAPTIALQNPLWSPGAKFQALVVVTRPLEQHMPRFCRRNWATSREDPVTSSHFLLPVCPFQCHSDGRKKCVNLLCLQWIWECSHCSCT